MQGERSRQDRTSRFSRCSKGSQAQPSQRSSLFSLDRYSQKQYSLSKRASLINIMDIQMPQNNNRASGMSIQQQFIQYQRNSNRSLVEPYDYQPTIQQKDLNRKSGYKIKHQCKCNQNQCYGHHCACFFSNQICVVGQCCPSCIQRKNQYLRATRGWQLQKQKRINQDQRLKNLLKGKNSKNMHYIKQVYVNQPLVKQLVFCTCKKSHCLKNYCICFEKGLICGKYCSCIQCSNIINDDQERHWQRYGNYEPDISDEEHQVNVEGDISQYIETQMINEQFVAAMQFQPVDFTPILQQK